MIVALVLGAARVVEGDRTERVAIYTVAGGVLVALVGLVGIWLQTRANGRTARVEHVRTRAEVEKVYEHVNNVEAGAEVPDGDEPITLGRIVRKIERTLDEGFARNDETHEAIRRTVEAQGETIHAHGARLDEHRAELDRLWSSRNEPGTTTKG